MLMFKCPHCGSISNEPNVVKTSKCNYAECKWCGQVIKKLNHNDTMILKEMEDKKND